MYASYSLRLGEATKKVQFANGNSQSMSTLRMVMANDSTNFIPCLMFYSPFHISSALLTGYCKGDPHCKVLALLYLVQLSKFSLNQSSVLLIEGLDRFCHKDNTHLISSVH